MARNPSRAKQRADEIAELISEAGEKLIDLSIQWFELNDEKGLSQARQMLTSQEVTLMLSAHLEAGMGHISINLLRTGIPMPRPFFEIKTPMLPWTLESPATSFGANEDSSLWRFSRNRRAR